MIGKGHDMDDLYKVKEFKTSDIDVKSHIGHITEKEKFVAAKQILFGIGILYILTVAASLYKPEDGKLIDICTTTFPPLVTLILACYFRDKSG